MTNRPVRYRQVEIKLPDGTIHKVETPQEKGIDLPIGLDVVRRRDEIGWTSRSYSVRTKTWRKLQTMSAKYLVQSEDGSRWFRHFQQDPKPRPAEALTRRIGFEWIGIFTMPAWIPVTIAGNASSTGN